MLIVCLELTWFKYEFQRKTGYKKNAKLGTKRCNDKISIKKCKKVNRKKELGLFKRV